jgi:hypothetical protein
VIKHKDDRKYKKILSNKDYETSISDRKRPLYEKSTKILKNKENLLDTMAYKILDSPIYNGPKKSSDKNCSAFDPNEIQGIGLFGDDLKIANEFKSKWFQDSSLNNIEEIPDTNHGTQKLLRERFFEYSETQMLSGKEIITGIRGNHFFSPIVS